MILAVTALLSTMGPGALGLVMALVLLEGAPVVGAFVPGDSLMFSTGILVAAGVVPISLWLLLPGVVLAAVAADQLGFTVGRRWGPRLLSGHRSSRLLRADHVHTARALFDRHGRGAVALARFVPVARSLVPALAGLSGMPRGRFTAAELLGATAWGAVLPLAGYLLGGLPLVAAHVELCLLALVLVALAPALVAALRHGSRRSRLESRAPGALRLGPRSPEGA